jgi:hypothetical protein
VNESTKRAHIWAKAREAQEAGNTIVANTLLNASVDLEAPTLGRPAVTCLVSANPILVVAVPTTSVLTRMQVEDNLIYTIGVVTNHQDIGFTPFFNKKNQET